MKSLESFWDHILQCKKRDGSKRPKNKTKVGGKTKTLYGSYKSSDLKKTEKKVILK